MYTKCEGKLLLLNIESNLFSTPVHTKYTIDIDCF